jgi:glycosyltransferase involved in cell wall biosynthesis
MTMPMRIAMFVAGLDIGAADGGAESSGAELALRLRAMGHAVMLFAFWRSNTDTEARWLARLADADLQAAFLTRAGAARNSGDAGPGLRQIAAVLRAHDVDVAHAHHEGAALGLTLARLAGVRPSMALLRTSHMPLHLEWGVGLVARLLRIAASSLAFPLVLDAEAVVSPWYARGHDARAVARLSRKPACMIYNARALVPRAPRDRRADQPAVVGAVGRLVEQKRPDLLIEALPLIRARLPACDVRLAFAGDGPLRQQLVARAEALGVGPWVTFLGQRDDVPALLDAWTAFALPSTWEGLPNVLLEAVAHGTPVVASAIPGVLDVIDDARGGVLFAPGDVNALASAVVAQLEDRDRARAMAVHAQNALPTFSLDAAAQRYLTLYRELVAKRAGR